MTWVVYVLRARLSVNYPEENIFKIKSRDSNSRVQSIRGFKDRPSWRVEGDREPYGFGNGGWLGLWALDDILSRVRSAQIGRGEIRRNLKVYDEEKS